MSGEFECRARNSVGEGNDVLTLTVQYAPEVTTKVCIERINPNEGERVEVECLVDANPKASVIKWSGPNGFSSDDPTLVLKSVSRENSGNYTCLATNYLNIYGQTGSQTRTGTSITFVDVKRRPGKAVISPSHLNVVVGDIIELLCSAADLGSPEAQFKWSSPSSGGQFGTREHDQASLIVRNAQLADNGRYRCRAYNSLGEGDEAVVDVKVIEPAKISRPLATERIFQANEAANGLECEAEGYPVPSFQWFKDGQPIDQERYKTESTIVKTSCSERDFCTLIVMGSLFFSIPIQWTDKGNYSCVASNGASERNSNNLSWTVVRVIHGPVILNQRFPIDSLAAADVLSMARLKCIVSARPEPKFSWMFSSSVIEETDRYSFQFNRIYERPDEYEHILQISETVDTDYGSYLCRATNGVGTKAEVIVRLTHTGLPQVPDAVQKLSSTPQSLLIGWQPGFDGGFEQSFVVEYRLLNPFTESFGKEDVATVEVHNVTKIEEIKDDGTISWIISYNLTGLRPLSSYYVRTRAANKKGISEFSPLVTATTNDVNEDPKMLAPRSLSFDILKQSIHVECFTESSSAITPWRLALIIPVAALAFLILLMCALFVICFRSRSPTKIVKNGIGTSRPSTITVLSQSEAKNAMVHGSQTDSGVFTLDSGRIKGNNFIAPHTYSSSSEETAVENWPPEQYDITNDPYLSEQARHVFPGDMDDQMEEASISGTEDEDGRRVMREIIV
uniref:Down syndrome cell adhesion molecule-like protein Dscam2 n=1 Tax=Heterorhabditis bacteriophora TaxID=37862 RepID=A0A1I7WGH0_HETBA